MKTLSLLKIVLDNLNVNYQVSVIKDVIDQSVISENDSLSAALKQIDFDKKTSARIKGTVKRIENAVKNRNKPDTKKGITEIIKEKPADVSRFDDSIFGNPPQLSPFQHNDRMKLLAIIFLMGLESESEKLRLFARKVDDSSTSGHALDDDFELADGLSHAIFESAVDNVKIGNAIETIHSLEIILSASRKINEIISATEKKVSPSITGNNLALLSDLSILTQKCFQTLMDIAITELENKTNSVTLGQAEKILKKKIMPVIDKSKIRAGTHEITHSVFEQKGGKHLDFFLKDSKKHSVRFDYYESDQKKTELQMNVKLSYFFRMWQIVFLKKIYGLERNKGKLTDEARENNSIVSKMKNGLRLHNNDDWRIFLGKKLQMQFDSQKKKLQKKNPTASEKEIQSMIKKDTAFSNVISLLRGYFAAFTIHSPYNIYDTGPPEDNYLINIFPRSLTGQLIHDCGVYALRAAYMLSNVREELKLRIQYVVLPLHVGLVITVGNTFGFPIIIIHNNSVNEISVKNTLLNVEHWLNHDKTGKRLKMPHSESRTQFLAELASSHFIPNIDIPFRFEELTNFKKGNVKQKYWKEYKKNVTLAKPVVDDEFALKYLEVIDRYKEIHNESLIPVWNGKKPLALWKTKGENLLKKLKEFMVSKKPDQAKQYSKLADKYILELGIIFQKSLKEKKKLDLLKNVISKTLNNDGKLVKEGTISHGRRFKLIFDYMSFMDLFNHEFKINKMKNKKNHKNSQEIIPPFIENHDRKKTKPLFPIF